jgi:hypothetical protein
MKIQSQIFLMSVVLTCLASPRSTNADNRKEHSGTVTAQTAASVENSNRRTGMHDGNRIRSAFSNYGNLGSRTLELRGEWPQGSGINYLFECSFYVGAEVVDANNETLHIFTDSYTGGPGDRSPTDSHNYAWEPLSGFFNEGPANFYLFPAMSHLPDTWPALWPNRALDWAGKWIGESGPWPMAVQESYYVMDDRSNDEFAYYPFVGSHQDSLPWPTGRRGLGLEVQVRACQWDDPRLQDVWFAIYDIKNVSHKYLPRVVCGFYHDWDIGTEGSRSDAGDDDITFDAQNSMAYQWDEQGHSVTGKPTGYVTQKILQSPDNLGLTSFYGTTSGDALSKDEETWQVKTRPGTFKVINADGLPFDVAFITGSGYFSLQPGETKRYALAITMGQDIETLLLNSRMAQWFYDGGYSFAIHQVELLYPLGGEVVQGAVNITWKAQSATGPLLVDIFYSNDDWETWHAIAFDQENDGIYPWNSNAVGDGINYSIRVVAHNASGMGPSPSSNHFTINNPPAALPEVYITSPTGNQTVSGRYDVRWRAGDADGDVVTVNLFYSPDSGQIWHLLAENKAHDGIYSWDTTPLANGNAYLLKAIVSDGALHGVDVLNGSFRIANDHPAINSTFVEHVAGSSNAAVDVHFIDLSALTDHTFELSFTPVDTKTNYQVYDLDAQRYVLRNERITPEAEGTPFLGVRLWLHDFKEPTPIDSLTHWIVGDANLVLHVEKDPSETYVAIPADFEIRVLGANADTAYSPLPRLALPVNFQVWNVTDSVKMEFIFTENDVPDGRITVGDILTLITNRTGRRYNTAWKITFRKPVLPDCMGPEYGDVARIVIARPFAETDVYRFQTLPEYVVSVPVETRSLESFSLQQNFPNPFNAGTTIEYHIAEATKVRMQIFDVLGRKVATLVDGHQRSGLQRIYWNGRDEDHHSVANGIYFYRITAGNYVETKKMILLK